MLNIFESREYTIILAIFFTACVNNNILKVNNLCIIFLACVNIFLKANKFPSTKTS